MFRHAVFFALCLPAAAMADPSGPVRVIDGDTFDVGGTRVRLHAIDAPEAVQMCGTAQSPAWSCGAWVTEQTRLLFDGRKATCAARDTDRYGRVVATCTVDGRDVGQVLVSEGLAFAYRRYGMDYDLTEKQTVVAGRGLHATGVTSPASFRAAQRGNVQPIPVRDGTGAKTVRVREPSETKNRWLPDALNPACKIKGNISRNDGERIYHMPGQEYYDDTRISPTKGERWFCTEAEARAAGWRKARK